MPTPREGDRDFRYDRDDLPDNPPKEGWWGGSRIEAVKGTGGEDL